MKMNFLVFFVCLVSASTPPTEKPSKRFFGLNMFGHKPPVKNPLGGLFPFPGESLSGGMPPGLPSSFGFPGSSPTGGFGGLFGTPVGGFGGPGGGFGGPGGGFGGLGGGFGGLGESEGCRYWCKTPLGQIYCCEDSSAPVGLVGVKLGLCPAVRPECPAVRSILPPTSCSNDFSCIGRQKCCFDTCLQQHVCKASIVGF